MMLADVSTGGFSHGLFKWFKFQKEVGIDFKVLAYGDQEKIYKLATLKHLDPELLKTYPILGSTPKAFSLKALRSVLNGDWDDYDICHQHGMWSFSSIISLIWAKRTKKPVIIQPHGMLFPEILGHNPLLKQVALKTYEGYNLKHASYLVSTSDSESQTIRTLLPNAKIEQIKCLFDVPQLIDNDTLNIYLGKYKFLYKQYWLYLGRIHPKKGIDLLIEGYNMLQDKLPLVIVGPKEIPEYYDSILKQIKNYNLSNEVFFVPEVSEIEKLSLMRGAKAFVLPTRSENFGTVVAEALGQQCPVICTIGAPWSTLEQYKCGWWVDIDPKSISSALCLSFNQDSIEQKIMGANGHKLLENELDPQKIALQTKFFYNTIKNQHDNN
ncbi:MAG: putative glycosyltransferase [Bacteroidetes bacterium]|nr:putative glycosyltransferase [Bacteroidota bacterium]